MEPAATYRRALVGALAVKVGVDPRTGPLFSRRQDLRHLAAADRDAVMDAVAQALARWWQTDTARASVRRYFATMPRWF